MTPLTEQQVARVADYLQQARLPTALQTDLLDHLCCEVEQWMARGSTFEVALSATTAAWPLPRLTGVKKDLQFITKTKPMLLRLTAAAAILAGFFFLSPPTSSSVMTEPCPVANTLPEPLSPVAFEPPSASPLAGVDMATQLTSGFGMRLHPVLKKKQLHRGIDLKAKSGTPVLATADGEVYFAGEDGLYGIVVRIQHADGYQTVFA
ncbi:MAG: M23 family metallopeptidase, partial [Bacteroidota bacterium]